eukprot:TRINITY_DN101308_c0_g1_i1.p1 TRINITY_DN101308_c0_g1~~TRINITY_DN101308_c0_g1_i1.p1  ORF type:complete len:246 (+),score=14.37 TRINITY_DN101308_c0_g1_i1:78-740(+)
MAVVCLLTNATSMVLYELCIEKCGTDCMKHYNKTHEIICDGLGEACLDKCKTSDKENFEACVSKENCWKILSEEMDDARTCEAQQHCEVQGAFGKGIGAIVMDVLASSLPLFATICIGIFKEIIPTRWPKRLSHWNRWQFFGRLGWLCCAAAIIYGLVILKSAYVRSFEKGSAAYIPLVSVLALTLNFGACCCIFLVRWFLDRSPVFEYSTVNPYAPVPT